MATRYGRTFTTRRGRRGRYKYVNGRRVAFTTLKVRRSYPSTPTNYKSSRYGQRRRRYVRRY